MKLKITEKYKNINFFENIKDACKIADLIIIHTEWNEFKQINFIYIFLNTRKIYLQKENITENSKKKPKFNYEKNKLIII